MSVLGTFGFFLNERLPNGVHLYTGSTEEIN